MSKKSDDLESLQEALKEGLEIHPPSEGWHMRVDRAVGEDIQDYLSRTWADYQRACEIITRQMYIFKYAHDRAPAAIYATNELLCILQRGHILFTNGGNGKPATFRGVPILPCAGCGQAFHFAVEEFFIDGPKPILKKEENQ